MTVWIVQGSTGEYSDHEEWIVGGFLSRSKAQRLVVEAQARVNELYASEVHSIPLGSNEFDPRCKFDYTGTHYTCFGVDVDEEMP
jgi:hypothetical protein